MVAFFELFFPTRAVRFAARAARTIRGSVAIVTRGMIHFLLFECKSSDLRGHMQYPGIYIGKNVIYLIVFGIFYLYVILYSYTSIMIISHKTINARYCMKRIPVMKAAAAMRVIKTWKRSTTPRKQ